MIRNRWMQRATLWLVVVMMAVSVTGMSCAEEKDRLAGALDKIFKNHHTVGGAVIIARDGEIVYEHYYGYASKTGRSRVTKDTYFRLASVTKMVTAIRVMQLVEEGVLDLDRDISEYLGYQVGNAYYPQTPITLRMLMTHTSSLNQHGGYQRSDRSLSELIDGFGHCLLYSVTNLHP